LVEFCAGASKTELTNKAMPVIGISNLVKSWIFITSISTP